MSRTVNEQFISINNDGVHTWYREDNPTVEFRKLVLQDGYVNGPFEEYYPNGKLKIKAIFENNDLNGQFEEYYMNGNKKYVTVYNDGVPTITIQTWYPSGNLRSTVALDKHGLKNGKSTEYYDTDEQRTPASLVWYHNNRKHGPAYKYTKKGELMIRTSYTNDKLCGEYERYHPVDPVNSAGNSAGNPDGSLMIYCTFRDGLLEDKYVARYPNGKLKRVLNFVGGKLHGRSFFYNKHGLKSSCSFVNGQLNGKYCSIKNNKMTNKDYSNGQLVTAGEA